MAVTINGPRLQNSALLREVNLEICQLEYGLDLGSPVRIMADALPKVSQPKSSARLSRCSLARQNVGAPRVAL
jgi:hypothetical protein